MSDAVAEGVLFVQIDRKGKASTPLAAPFGLSLEERPQLTPAPVDGGIADVARRCVSLGLLTQTEADNALAAITEGGAPAEGAHPVYSLLTHAKRLVFFDVEDGDVPVRHDRLLGWFADASACRFRPECAREDYVPASDLEGSGTYLVEFIHDGRLYRFHPRNMGDWYDVDSVVAAINQAMADTGVPERFLALANRGQWAGFVFGHPDMLRRAGPDIGLSLSAGSD